MNTTILLSIMLITLCMIGISIKILIKKNGKFSGTCASNNPFLNNDSEKCSYCGASSKEECKNEENSSEK